jgi:hypothetical protein
MQDRITLDEVKQAFDQWRAGKRDQRERASSDLRAQVKAIAPYYSRRQIIKELAITTDQMNRYVEQNQSTESSAMLSDLSSNKFIEFPMSELLKREPKSVPALGLTITRGDGSSWALSEATQDVISESLRLFLRS